MLAAGKQRAVFLDRDGVINVSPSDGFVRSIEQFVFIPGSREAIADLARHGFRLIVVSNQSGVGQGVYTSQALDEITDTMTRAIRQAGGRLDGVYYCVHQPTAGCRCRKPGPGLIERAVSDWLIDLPHSYIIGDDARDIVLGHTVGCRTVLVLSGKTTSDAVKNLLKPPARVCENLRAAADWILGDSGVRP